MTDEQLKAEIRTALNLGSLSKGLGEDFPYAARFEGICKEYAAAQVAEKDAEITRLKAENERLREGLKGLKSCVGYNATLAPHLTGGVEVKLNDIGIAIDSLLSPASKKPEEKPQKTQWRKMSDTDTFEDGEWVCFRFGDQSLSMFQYRSNGRWFYQVEAGTETVLYRDHATKLHYMRISPEL